jgi:type IV pilus assembly protein PilW
VNAPVQPRRSRPAGFTLVEVMIGMLIGVIGIVVIMQVYAVSEGYKRTATTGSDAQVNGSVALYLLEREIRLAGFGMNALLPAGCTTVRTWNNASGTGTDLPVMPFQINPAGVPAGDANTDVIVMAYGASDNFVTGVAVAQAGSPTDDFKIAPSNNGDGFRNGDLVVAMQPGAGPGGGPQCVLHELTAVPGNGGNCGRPSAGPQWLAHGVVSYPSAATGCQPQAARFNSASGIRDANGANVAALNGVNSPLLYNLGPTPQVKAYAVRGGNLATCDLLSQDCNAAASWQVVASDIVSLRAIYGEDFDGNPAPSNATGDGRVDQWSRAPITTANQASRTLAAALEITARNSLREKPRSGSQCDATVDPARPDRAQPQDWYQPFVAMASGSLAGAAIDLSSTSPDWKCYRYKLFQTSVPIRNMIWKPK